MDLWMSGDDDRILCGKHIGAELRAAIGGMQKGQFKVRTDSQGWWTRFSPTMATLEDLSCEVCGAEPAFSGLGSDPAVAIDWRLSGDPEWQRVPFPAGWIDDVAWPWLVQVAHGIYRANGLAITDVEQDLRREWREQEDGTLHYRGYLDQYRLELVTAPAFGCWLRLLTVPVLPGRPGSVQREEQVMVVPMQGGLQDPATFARTLYHFAFPGLMEGMECAGPIGGYDLTPTGSFTVTAADGAQLARGLDADAALTQLQELAGRDGTVHVVRNVMKAFHRLPDPNGASWLDHGHGRLVATAAREPVE
ncbi:hypothetical protein AXK56_22575 [Tsukamurella pulmonis]|uniref:Uncharacterized protein n=1 Tax=Tsukamurella pulmonis TaxID=47312 RepID=A0A1H1ADF3_9ACTN|nr:hypothetical protein [Tsukamurella pulmonis]KXO92793.1 hypothetical protein AXK56_22575 [Tsukamurella pulmonis]SDQ37610.1 hypothetical protein SAMN04489765_0168 [Tsukamurella pulmonis]SUQ39368.1 Uncharacterised protein [Tsukamurella pulmonis]